MSLSPARQHRLRVQAEQAAREGGSVRHASGYDLMLLQLAEDRRRLKGVQSTVKKAEIKVELLGGGTLAALGTADPKPDRLLPFAGPVCPLYDGAAMAIIRSEGGAKGALLRVTLGDLVAELGIGFTPVAAQSLPVHEAAPSAADLPLGTLLENEKARAVLAKVLGPMLESPMLAQMKSMSLKKLLSMGGQTLPPEVLHALDAACAEE